MGSLNLLEDIRVVRLGEIGSDGLVHLAHVLGQDDVEVYDVSELVRVISADCVNDLLKGTHHLQEVNQAIHCQFFFFCSLANSREVDGTPLLEVQFVVI